MAKLNVPKKSAKHPPVADRSKTRALKADSTRYPQTQPITGDRSERTASKARSTEVSAREEQLIRDTVKQIVRIHREAFQELEKY